MALNAYLTLKGQKQGQINGSVTQKGREGSIQVESYSHEIISPRDPATGLPIGKRQHHPLVLVKENDRSSPLLYTALVTNENLTTFELRFWTPQLRAVAGVAADVQHYTIRLTNASIASIREFMLDTTDTATTKAAMREEVTFTYQSIQWTWTEGNIVAQDDWHSPVA